MSRIHPSAIIADGAELGEDVEIGPYCLIGPNVRLGRGVKLLGHVVIDGHTEIGDGTQIYPFAVLGQPPQHLGYKGEPTRLIIGQNNIIREHFTMHPGTVMGRGETTVGSNGLFMAAGHFAHDCVVGDNVILANNATVGGHVEIGNYVFLGAMAAVHQFVRIGDYAFVGGMAALLNDLIPYGSARGNPAYLAGLNIVGMKRRSVSREKIHTLRNAYRILFSQEGTLQERLNDVAELFDTHSQVTEIVEFVRAASNRSVCLPKLDRGS